MKELIAVGMLFMSNPLFAANLRPTSPVTNGDVCGTVIKIGDLDESRNSITVKTDAGEILKIYIEGVSIAISPELIRATLALANEVHYCARVSSADEKSAYLVRSSIEKK